MIYKFLAVLFFSLPLHALTVGDFSEGGLVDSYVYGAVPIPSGEGLYGGKPTISFNSHDILGSERIDKINGYISAQGYLPKYDRESVRVNTLYMEYLLQNAGDKQKLLLVAEEVRQAELCLHFIYNDTVKFVHERAFSMLTGDGGDIASERLTAGVSVVINQLKASPFEDEQVSHVIVGCSGFVNVGDDVVGAQ